MKLIIDIPEDIRVTIDKMGLLRIPVEMQKKVDKAIQHGAPLEQIRAEIDSYCSDNRDRNDGLYIAMKIIDKYKASPTGAEGANE